MIRRGEFCNNTGGIISFCRYNNDDTDADHDNDHAKSVFGPSANCK